MSSHISAFCFPFSFPIHNFSSVFLLLFRFSDLSIFSFFPSYPDMASSDSSQQQPPDGSSFVRLILQLDPPVLIPFMFGFSATLEHTNTDTSTTNNRLIFINPFAQTMTVISSADSDYGEKIGQPPASKASIEAMGSVEMSEGEGGECVICLEEWRGGDMAKEMPCRHRFHGECIEKWLGIHGTCPVCRYEMPVEEEGVGKKRDEEGGVLGRFSLDFGGGVNSSERSVDGGDSSASEEDHEDHAM